MRARIGFMPVELHLDRHYTVPEAIDFLGALRGGFDEASVWQLQERFDLDPGRTIGDLSTGNRRKVGVIQAFAGLPELLILDQPTSGLDPLLQHELLTLIEERVAEGATVFLSSHVLPEVERVADRVAIMRRGELVSIGTIDELHSGRASISISTSPTLRIPRCSATSPVLLPSAPTATSSRSPSRGRRTR